MYVPCTAHCLNLVGNNAAEICTEAITFFSILEDLHTSFSVSIFRCSVLKRYLPLDSSMLKKLSETLWLARYKLCSMLREALAEVQRALLDIHEEESQNLKTQNYVQCHHQSLCKLKQLIWLSRGTVFLRDYMQ